MRVKDNEGIYECFVYTNSSSLPSLREWVKTKLVPGEISPNDIAKSIISYYGDSWKTEQLTPLYIVSHGGYLAFYSKSLPEKYTIL